jgi:hypothetical protein
MKTTILMAVVVSLVACGYEAPEEQAQQELAADGGSDGGSLYPWVRATWEEQPPPGGSCVGGAYVGNFVTTGGVFAVSSIPRIGSIPAPCCPAPSTVTATCSCPLHGDKVACQVVIASDCSMALLGHSEYAQTVVVKF